MYVHSLLLYMCIVVQFSVHIFLIFIFVFVHLSHLGMSLVIFYCINLIQCTRIPTIRGLNIISEVWDKIKDQFSHLKSIGILK